MSTTRSSTARSITLTTTSRRVLATLVGSVLALLGFAAAASADVDLGDTSGRTYAIHTADKVGGRLLDLPGSPPSVTAGTQVVARAATGAMSQQWRVTRAGKVALDGTVHYQFVNAVSGLCLRHAWDGRVVQGACYDTGGVDRWRVIDDKYGVRRIVSTRSPMTYLNAATTLDGSAVVHTATAGKSWALEGTVQPYMATTPGVVVSAMSVAGESAACAVGWHVALLPGTTTPYFRYIGDQGINKVTAKLGTQTDGKLDYASPRSITATYANGTLVALRGRIEFRCEPDYTR